MIGVRGSSGGGSGREMGRWIETASYYHFICSAGGYTSLYSCLLSLVLCNGAMSASVQRHNFDEWGRGLEALEERRVLSYIGGLRGRCRIVPCVNESVRAATRLGYPRRFRAELSACERTISELSVWLKNFQRIYRTSDVTVRFSVGVANIDY